MKNRLSVNPVLLVWKEVPESVNLYWFENLSKEEYDNMIQANGTFINSTNENDSTKWLYALVDSFGRLVNSSDVEDFWEDSDMSMMFLGDGTTKNPIILPCFSKHPECTLIFSGFVL